VTTDLTRGERDRTILLLRCAVEVAVTGNYILGPSWVTAPRLGLGKRECRLATRAAQRVARDIGKSTKSARDLEEYVGVLLEAALRIEERSWP
jgi:hypothetical protein